MVREDPTAEWSHVFEPLPGFAYTSTLRFGVAGFSGFTTQEYNRAFAEQRRTPVWLGVEGGRCRWWFRDRVWCADRELSAEAVAAAAAEPTTA